MTDSFGEVVPLHYENFTSNINTQLQYFGIIFKNFEKGLYTIEISKDEFGKDSIKQNIKIKRWGTAKKVIIPMLVGGIAYVAYYFLLKDKGTKSSNPPPLPGPPLPGE